MKLAKEREPRAVEAAKAPGPMPAPTSPKPAPTPSKTALGKVSGSASGGQILQKEEISADVLNILKVNTKLKADW